MLNRGQSNGREEKIAYIFTKYRLENNGVLYNDIFPYEAHELHAASAPPFMRNTNTHTMATTGYPRGATSVQLHLLSSITYL